MSADIASPDTDPRTEHTPDSATEDQDAALLALPDLPPAPDDAAPEPAGKPPLTHGELLGLGLLLASPVLVTGLVHTVGGGWVAAGSGGIAAAGAAGAGARMAAKARKRKTAGAKSEPRLGRLGRAKSRVGGHAGGSGRGAGGRLANGGIGGRRAAGTRAAGKAAAGKPAGKSAAGAAGTARRGPSAAGSLGLTGARRHAAGAKAGRRAAAGGRNTGSGARLGRLAGTTARRVTGGTQARRSGGTAAGRRTSTGGTRRTAPGSQRPTGRLAGTTARAQRAARIAGRAAVRGGKLGASGSRGISRAALATGKPTGAALRYARRHALKARAKARGQRGLGWLTVWLLSGIASTTLGAVLWTGGQVGRGLGAYLDWHQRRTNPQPPGAGQPDGPDETQTIANLHGTTDLTTPAAATTRATPTSTTGDTVIKNVVDTLVEAIDQLAHWDPDDSDHPGEEYIALFESYPSLLESFGHAIQANAQKLEDSPINSSVIEMTSEIGGRIAGEGEFATNLLGVFNNAHEADRDRIEEPRTNEHHWNVAS